MDTTIHFIGHDKLDVRVKGSPDEVHGALLAERGNPVALERADGERVYVRPDNIAYWHTAPDYGAAQFS